MQPTPTATKQTDMSMTIEHALQRIEVLEDQMQSLLANKIKDDKKTKKDKKIKKDDANSDDTVKKKKKTSGYLMHNASQRPHVKEAMEKEIADANNIILAENAELPEDEHKPLLKLKSTSVLTHLAAAWKALDDDARSKWNADAALKNDTDTESDNDNN
jgi:hypothetical protein